MSMSNSRLAYRDCYEALDRALVSNKGVLVVCQSEGDAHHQRQRLNYARVLDRRDNREMYPSPFEPLHGRSHYDNIAVKLTIYEGSHCVHLQPNNLNARPIIELDAIEGGAELISNDSVPLLSSTHEDVFPPEEVEGGNSSREDGSGTDEGGGQGPDMGGTSRGGIRRI